MKITFLCVFFMLGQQIFCYAQNYYEDFKKLRGEDDTTKAIALLKEWEKNKSDDTELYVAGFNYYISLAAKELNKGSEENAEKLKRIDYKLNKSSEYINKGIQKFPDRLDMRFGKCYILIESKRYKELTDEVISTVERSALNKNKWFWMNNVPKENGEEFLLDNIQGYLKNLYETGDDSLLTNMLTIGYVTLKHYPNCIPVLSSTAVIHSLRKEYEKAITYLLKAESLNSKDMIVVKNIAECYTRMGDKDRAKKYFEKVIQLGSNEEKEEAREKLKALGK